MYTFELSPRVLKDSINFLKLCTCCIYLSQRKKIILERLPFLKTGRSDQPVRKMGHVSSVDLRKVSGQRDLHFKDD